MLKVSPHVASVSIHVPSQYCDISILMYHSSPNTEFNINEPDGNQMNSVKKTVIFIHV